MAAGLAVGGFPDCLSWKSLVGDYSNTFSIWIEHLKILSKGEAKLLKKGFTVGSVPCRLQLLRHVRLDLNHGAAEDFDVLIRTP
jgi:hypothetical protein